ncbi:hypothetical protein CAL29_20895 [Bordetella genomosp. 10]|uniref:Uncharacterized protein n=1 Tax=Bordetella genomosp. 10 TaxID=1416804 RepID=A0A261RZF9_9BORD|nr:hypothetical protein [Bordetella genomosp. 10]OZI30484.1 hypothetical protein CAL29_20895 [Bordetella genomosp. 10]
MTSGGIVPFAFQARFMALLYSVGPPWLVLIGIRGAAPFPGGKRGGRVVAPGVAGVFVSQQPLH